MATSTRNSPLIRRLDAFAGISRWTIVTFYRGPRETGNHNAQGKSLLMALVQCRECGSEISDSAATCPRCGVAAPGGTGTLIFVRPSLLNGAVGVEVFIDGQPYGALRAMGRLSVDIAPGNHHIELATSQGRSGVGTVSTNSGTTELTVKMSVMGTPKFS